MSHLPVLILVVYFAAALLLPLLAKLKKSSPGWGALAVTFLALLLSIASALYVGQNGPYSYFPGGHGGPGIEITVDWVTVLMHLTINLVGMLILVYSQGDLKSELRPDSLPAYYSIYLLMLAALNGLVMAGDLFNLYIFIEICTIAACALVAIKPGKLCLEAGLKYMFLSTLGSGMILLGIGLVYMVTGELNMGALSEAIPLAFSSYSWNIYVAMSLFIVGFGIKSALFPLHVWLPDAHASAAAPSSAIHSGLIIKVFIIVVARLIFQVFGANLFAVIPAPEVILLLSTIGIFAGSVLAIAQTDIKRMLAYSTIAQISYIFMGFALAVPSGIMGGLLHIVNHGIMKSMLFLAAGAIIYKTGIRKIDELRGIGFRMPLTMSIFSIGALSMVGIPGFSGFISKYYLAFGALEAGKPIYVAVILASSLLNAIYYLPIVVRAFLGQKEGKFVWDQLPWPMAAAMVVLAAFNLFFGILPGSLLRLVELAATALLS